MSRSLGTLMGLNSLFLFLCTLYGCTEPFELATIDFEELLVVEGLVTNELKRHEVKLSKSTQLESSQTIAESGAQISVSGNDGSNFKYSQEGESNIYRSDVQFQAVPGVIYQLQVVTENGKEYRSEEVLLSAPIGIASVYAELGTEVGREGIHIFLDSEESENEVEYFRYEFEETYEIEVPNPSNWSWEIADYDFRSGFYDLKLNRRKPETICYTTIPSKGILQTSTAGLEKKRVSRFPLHYLHRTSPVLRERYSILAKQYTQSLAAHTFFRTLSDLGSAESLLSQGQPGFLPGNIVSTANVEEKVLGYFEVSSVTTKRIFFNYEDFGLQFPPYFNQCVYIKTFPTAFLIRKLEVEDYQIVDFEEDGPQKLFKIFREVCTDCTTFSSNVKPDFWTD